MTMISVGETGLLVHADEVAHEDCADDCIIDSDGNEPTMLHLFK